ncbi:alkyldihydroxyacetonephosphate synthase AgpS, partial [mine drainage metagenome]
GWIATRAGGHYATLYTHIDDFVEAIDLITPAGRLSTLRFPASGAGPQPERLILGSEGAFGIITQAWMRLQDRPQFKSVESASFSRFEDAISALKQLSQSGLNPSNLRLLDPIEAAISIGDSSGDTIVLVGFESKDLPTQGLMSQATEILASHTGKFQKPTS